MNSQDPKPLADMEVPVWGHKTIGFGRFLDDSMSRVITIQMNIS